MRYNGIVFIKLKGVTTTMKKLFFCLALAALATVSASADIALTDWKAWNSKEYDYTAANYVTDYGTNGFDVDTTGLGTPVVADFGTDTVTDWFYNANTDVKITVSGFEGIYSPQPPEYPMYINILLEDPHDQLYLAQPWTGAGTYTFTSKDYIDDYYVPWDMDNFGKPLTRVGVFVASSNAEYMYLAPGTTGRVIFGDADIDPDPDPEEETVVPEPCTIAYALTGLGSLIGMKKKFAK